MNKSQQEDRGIFKKISNYFEFAKHKTNYRTEILAGVSTFLALSYIFVVNPSILGEGGFNKSAVLFATVITCFLATFIMGVWAKKPFAVAPGMEMNAYVAFFVILALGFTWQEALGAVFWSGVIFMILTLTNVRTKIINAIPDKMKSGLALCVGVFLMLIALRLAGVLVYSGVRISGLGIFFSPLAYVLYFGLALTLILRKFKIPGAVLISIVLSTLSAYILGLGGTATPVQFSTEMFSAIFQLDLGVIFNVKMISVILVLFLIDFYGSIAKFIGLTRGTTIVNKDGTMPQMKEALSVDGAGTMVGASLGTSSMVAYVESAVGISEGGRTGFTAVVISILMLAMIFLTPLISLVPVIATTGALFWVGIALFPSREELKTYTKLDIVTVLIMIGAVIWTFSIDRALLFGFSIFILGLLFTKRIKEINPFMVISTVLLALGWILSVVVK
ncbi:NCS2 family permease [Candidatus Woesearchaeota archaeon]|nr:NCS2 family permease [Candidatus Woesearchaeota archaeon]